MSASRKKSSSSIKTETNNKPTTKKQDALNKEFVKIFEENGLDKMAKEMGSTLKAPYMSLSFMALLVIPSLKLSDKGLFDGTNFKFTSLEVE